MEEQPLLSPLETKPITAAGSSRPARHNRYALTCAALASMTSVLMGYHVGVMSGAQMFMKQDLGLTDIQVEILTGCINIYTLAGSLPGGWTSDVLGRRATVVLAAALFFLGSVTMSLAPGYAVLMIGRFLAGVGAGYALVVAPVYTSEISPPSSRGFLSSLPELFINAGILISYVVNLAFSGLQPWLAWRVMIAVAAVPPVFIAVAVLAMPESPRWLVMRGRITDARHVLDRTSDDPATASIRLQEIKEAIGGASDKPSSQATVWKELLVRPTPLVRRVLATVLAIQFFQQACGIDTVVLYGPRVFEKAGFLSSTAQLTATVAVGVVKAGSILIAIFFSDRVGRRPLLLSSAGGMAASLLILATGLEIMDHNNAGSATATTWTASICVVAVMAFVFSFSVGFGPLAWVYSSEILPLRLRAQGAGVGTAMNRAISALVTMTYISLYETITIAGTFYMYAGIVSASWLFIYFRLPETRGRSLEDMAALFAK